MRLPVYVYLVPLFALIYVSCAPVKENHPVASERSPQQIGSASDTYADTIRMLKTWQDTSNHADLGRLFKEGRSRDSDLLAACRSNDDQLALQAFVIRHLLGSPPCGECPDSVRRKLGRLAPPCGDNLTRADLDRVDQWWAKRHTPDGYECRNEEGLLFDEDTMNEFLVRGSSDSRAVVVRLLAFEKSCEQAETVTAKTLDQTQSLLAATFALGQNLTLQPDIDTSVRASAFFIPSRQKPNIRVKLIARTDDRILLDVSYVCGGLCGRGYYVVLAKNGPAWRYAVVILAWLA